MKKPTHRWLPITFHIEGINDNISQGDDDYTVL